MPVPVKDLREAATKRFDLDEETGGRQLFVERGQGALQSINGGEPRFVVHLVYRLSAGAKVGVIAYELEPNNRCRQRASGIRRVDIKTLFDRIDGDNATWVHVGDADRESRLTSSPKDSDYNSTWTRRASGAAAWFEVSEDIANKIRALSERALEIETAPPINEGQFGLG